MIAALDAAARELMAAAGRPEVLVDSTWNDAAAVTEYDRQAWRVAAYRTVRKFLDELDALELVTTVDDALEALELDALQAGL